MLRLGLDARAGQRQNDGNPHMKILETERLAFRRLTLDDAEFVLQLVNEPAWLRFIGDKGIKTLDDARHYLLKGPLEMYAQFGFGLWLVELKDEGVPIGMCGLIKREALEDVDIGFAFLPAHWRKGYALESVSAALAYGKEFFGLRRVVAITSLDNDASGRLLEKLGFRFERTTRLSGAAPEVKLYGAAI